MNLGRVIGSLWTASLDPSLEGARFVLLQPVLEDLKPAGHPLVAVDTQGSGPGEIVLYITAYEAALPWKDAHPELDLVATDASVVAILDRAPEPAA